MPMSWEGAVPKLKPLKEWICDTCGEIVTIEGGNIFHHQPGIVTFWLRELVRVKQEPIKGRELDL